MTSIGLIDVVTAAGFAVALAIVIYARFARLRRLGALSATLIAVSLLLLLAVSVSNILEHAGITDALDPIEDHLEIAVMPLLVYAMYAWYAWDEIARTKIARRAAQSEHDMLVALLDASPVGVVLVDSDGRATYANEYAQRMLELDEESGHSHSDSPGRVTEGDADPRPPHLFSSVVGREFESRRMVYRSPRGTMRIGVSVGPMRSRTGDPLGSVVVVHRLDATTRDPE